MAGGPSKSRWTRDSYLDVGRVLLTSGGPMTAGEIADLTGAHQSNTKKVADAMKRDGLLIGEEPSSSPSGPGRRATVSYSLNPDVVAELERTLANTQVPGLLRRGQQLVIVPSAGPRINDLHRIFSEATETGRATWAATADGPFQGHAIVFDDNDGNGFEHANDLLSKLNACQIVAERATIVDIKSGPEFASQAKRRGALAEQARRTGRPSRLKSA